jgi:hypothetical protein
MKEVLIDRGQLVGEDFLELVDDVPMALHGASLFVFRNARSKVMLRRVTAGYGDALLG